MQKPNKQRMKRQKKDVKRQFSKELHKYMKEFNKYMKRQTLTISSHSGNTNQNYTIPKW
jgi:hypothetical protein